MPNTVDPKEPRTSSRNDARTVRPLPRVPDRRRGAALPSRLGGWWAALLVGAVLLAAWPVLVHLWWMERAGSLFDRYLVAGDPADLTQAGALLGMWAGSEDRPAPAPPPAPGSRDDGPAYWRTFGAIATHAPSEEAFALLLAARERGRLDRLGRLWLGEVAAATGHWEVAEQVYGSIDAVNLLVDRGEEAAAAGDRQGAAHWYSAAAASLAASGPRPDVPGARDPDDYLDGASNRAILLLRVGRGLLQADAAASALPVLEQAESEMHAHPPGVRDRQAIRFALAEALARTAPPDAAGDPSARVRATTLMERALEAADTGWARLQQAKVLLLLGRRSEAIAALRVSVDLDPESPEAYLTLGALLEEDGLASLARDLYGRGLEKVPEHPALSTAWAVMSFRTMTPAAALPRLVQAARTDTRDPYLFAALGDCHLALGDVEAARAAYHEGLRRSPGAAPLRNRLAKFARPTGVVP